MMPRAELPQRAPADLAPAHEVSVALDMLRDIARSHRARIVPGSIAVVSRADLPSAPPDGYAIHLRARVVMPDGTGGDLYVAACPTEVAS